MWRSLPESFTSLFQKRPPIQRAERWSPRARGEISLSAGSFLPSEGSRLRLRLSAARQFSCAPLLPKKKASKRFKKALCRKGNPPLVRFPSFGFAKIHPSVALPNGTGVSRLARRDRRSRRLRRAFEKARAKLSHKTTPWRLTER